MDNTHQTPWEQHLVYHHWWGWLHDYTILMVHLHQYVLYMFVHVLMDTFGACLWPLLLGVSEHAWLPYLAIDDVKKFGTCAPSSTLMHMLWISVTHRSALNADVFTMEVPQKSHFSLHTCLPWYSEHGSKFWLNSVVRCVYTKDWRWKVLQFKLFTRSVKSLSSLSFVETKKWCSLFQP